MLLCLAADGDVACAVLKKSGSEEDVIEGCKEDEMRQEGVKTIKDLAKIYPEGNTNQIVKCAVQNFLKFRHRVLWDKWNLVDLEVRQGERKVKKAKDERTKIARRLIDIEKAFDV